MRGPGLHLAPNAHLSSMRCRFSAAALSAGYVKCRPAEGRGALAMHIMQTAKATAGAVSNQLLNTAPATTPRSGE